MNLAPTSYHETRIWRASDDGHFFVFVCFERVPEGGFICPYAAKHRNWNFMSKHMEDLDLRHTVFKEISHPNARVFPTAEEAVNAFDLNQAVEG